MVVSQQAFQFWGNYGIDAAWVFTGMCTWLCPPTGYLFLKWSTLHSVSEITFSLEEYIIIVFNKRSLAGYLRAFFSVSGIRKDICCCYGHCYTVLQNCKQGSQNMMVSLNISIHIKRPVCTAVLQFSKVKSPCNIFFKKSYNFFLTGWREKTIVWLWLYNFPVFFFFYPRDLCCIP